MSAAHNQCIILNQEEMVKHQSKKTELHPVQMAVTFLLHMLQGKVTLKQKNRWFSPSLD